MISQNKLGVESIYILRIFFNMCELFQLVFYNAMTLEVFAH